MISATRIIYVGNQSLLLFCKAIKIKVGIKKKLKFGNVTLK